ncbi:NAD(P)H-binding protein [Streptomyces sp. H10-C2]|uniref:NAD(P)-dependent oxidoreductase n=1 Tax=unclassified Streptomyces TaxID=2593676 RepID=UPI0024B9BD19|nr:MULTISPECIES: NAD(P)H-binding protein [unclassified Streptomyces]MDJ0344652.1 NAD(P)H-binding protein [Streptomyces sp. PH10-H1]MDJ0373188.1 NAD(P)H-binding protein [Streptomyces sp. H10-C2]
MSRIAVFGAGGQLGRLVVAQAVGRGHQVTAVVRDPAKYPELAGAGVTLAAGDITDAGSVAALSAGHDVVVGSVYGAEVAAGQLYPAAARALLTGVGTTRLLVVGVVSTREVEPGLMVLDTPGFPAEGRDFSLARVAELELLRGAGPEVDWLLMMPPMEIDRALPAVEILDEIETPKHHRTAVPAGG